MIETRIDPERRRVINIASGEVTDEDVRSLRDTLRTDPQFADDFDQLFDLSAAAAISITGSTMAFAAAASAFRPGVRRAFVARTPFQFGMARMFSIYADSHNQAVEVFWDAAEATVWLDGRDQSPRPTDA